MQDFKVNVYTLVYYNKADQYIVLSAVAADPQLRVLGIYRDTIACGSANTKIEIEVNYAKTISRLLENVADYKIFVRRQQVVKLCDDDRISLGNEYFTSILTKLKRSNTPNILPSSIRAIKNLKPFVEKDYEFFVYTDASIASDSSSFGYAVVMMNKAKRIDRIKQSKVHLCIEDEGACKIRFCEYICIQEAIELIKSLDIDESKVCITTDSMDAYIDFILDSSSLGDIDLYWAQRRSSRGLCLADDHSYNVNKGVIASGIY